MEKYRTFVPRFVALLIDGFITLPIGILDSWFRQAELPPLFFYLWIPVASLVSPVYTIIMHGLYGQTLGKMAMNVRLLDAATEEPINFRQALLREAPQLVFNIAVIYLLIVFFPLTFDADTLKEPFSLFAALSSVWVLADVLVFLLTDKRRALHDYLAGTVVVKTNV